MSREESWQINQINSKLTVSLLWKIQIFQINIRPLFNNSLWLRIATYSSINTPTVRFNPPFRFLVELWPTILLHPQMMSWHHSHEPNARNSTSILFYRPLFNVLETLPRTFKFRRGIWRIFWVLAHLEEEVGKFHANAVSRSTAEGTKEVLVLCVPIQKHDCTKMSNMCREAYRGQRIQCFARHECPHQNRVHYRGRNSDHFIPWDC